MRKVVRAEQKIKETKICKYKGCQKAFHRENMNPSTWKKKEYCTRGCQAEAYRTRKSGSNVLPFKKKGIKNTIDAAGIVDAANTFNKKFRKRTKTKCYSCVKKRGAKKLSQEKLWELVPSAQPNYRENNSYVRPLG